MFTIGEFSKIAQVPSSVLRYYDDLGLLKPMHVDPWTNYRSYSATQLPRLNRILALKELGLSLDQIGRLLNDNVSADELRGMLALRKAQIEQSVAAELDRLRTVEARLQQLDHEGAFSHDDVVVKSVPAQPYLSLRHTLPYLFDGVALIHEIATYLPARIGSKRVGAVTAVMHGEAFALENVDIELGVVLTAAVDDSLTLPNGTRVAMRMLAAMDTAVTAVRVGAFENGYRSYAVLGRWVEQNGYRFVGPAREVLLVLPSADHGTDAVVEIQFPVAKRSSSNPLVS